MTTARDNRRRHKANRRANAWGTLRARAKRAIVCRFDETGTLRVLPFLSAMSWLRSTKRRYHRALRELADL